MFCGGEGGCFQIREGHLSDQRSQERVHLLATSYLSYFHVAYRFSPYSSGSFHVVDILGFAEDEVETGNGHFVF